ncbi:MAG: TolC family protein [Acidobacteria bacterium]|nr:TolC family protein [Acidobacteriota bacterium]
MAAPAAAAGSAGARRTRHVLIHPLLLLLGPACVFAQQPLTWQQVQARFEAANPVLQASALAVDESRAQEITAYLRPNPTFTATLDQLAPFPGSSGPYRPLSNVLPALSLSYLHERQHKRELRRDSAIAATEIAESMTEDQRRVLLFGLRVAFVQTLQAKSIRDLARTNLANWENVLSISQTRLKAGDISEIDYGRLQLQRVQYETDLQAAEVNLRTAKIQLLQLLNDRTSVEQFDVTGLFESGENLIPLEELHNLALEKRPDLRAALQAADKAVTDHQLAVANSSTDPTFSFDVGRNPPIPSYIGASINIPLRIFDRNQGERLRTEIDIRRTTRLKEAARAQVFADVDSSYQLLVSNLKLLRDYRTNYLSAAGHVRDTVAFAFQRGGASLLDFLSAQSDYRAIQLNYLNLVGSWLTAAAQMNLAVGQEVIQ